MPIFEKPKGAARGYAYFQSKKGRMKEKGAGGYAVFWKTPGAARGYADFNFKNVTGRKQPPEAMPFF